MAKTDGPDDSENRTVRTDQCFTIYNGRVHAVLNWRQRRNLGDAIVSRPLTKEELNRRGAGLGHTALFLLPVVGQLWAWRYSKAVEKVTDGRVTALRAMLYLMLLGAIGHALLQAAFNRWSSPPAVAE